MWNLVRKASDCCKRACRIWMPEYVTVVSCAWVDGARLPRWPDNRSLTCSATRFWRSERVSPWCFLCWICRPMRCSPSSRRSRNAVPKTCARLPGNRLIACGRMESHSPSSKRSPWLPPAPCWLQRTRDPSQRRSPRWKIPSWSCSRHAASSSAPALPSVLLRIRTGVARMAKPGHG